jgi:hypothetical protein
LLLCQLLWLRRGRHNSWHSSDGWYWTLSGWNNCPLRSHNSWHISNGWYWNLSGWNDCRTRSHNSWHSSDGWYWIHSGWISMVRYQLLWLRGRQSFQPLWIQYQPSLLCQLLDWRPRSHDSWYRTIDIWHSSDGWYWTLSGWNDCRLRGHNSWYSSNGWYWSGTSCCGCGDDSRFSH